jgi:hydroxymethylpyrimidine/phosphomethylpyrimidine kinase
VVTPNIPEARALTGLGEEASQAELARALVGMGAKAAVVTGGHSEEVIDVFYDGNEVVEISGERHPDGAAHGTGCTHSSTLAALLALGRDSLAAARGAREVTSEAVRNGLREIGAGAGPVDVFNLSGE